MVSIINPDLNVALSIIQILVGLLTLGGISFYMGKHSARVDRAEEDIQSLKTDATQTTSKIGELNTRTSVLESVVTHSGYDREAYRG